MIVGTLFECSHDKELKDLHQSRYCQRVISSVDVKNKSGLFKHPHRYWI